ncbi:multipass membrane protein [Oleiphilus messinensis]|uniref:Multipass membrane protein n=1 Tax=Oleiphilus messinensis TaxID=141451 RepID=A0A1Y0IEM0_9GAMM|nr:multipass membrane protein [Oleiphilus messinensis]
MHDTKSSSQVITELTFRISAATSGIYIFVCLIAIARGATQELSTAPLTSDDPYWVALFLSTWLLVPAIPSTAVRYKRSKLAGLATYWATAFTQTTGLYLVVSYMALDPESEIGSSALPLLVWVSLPLAAIYYPLFYWGDFQNLIRKSIISLGVLLILYGHWFRVLI